MTVKIPREYLSMPELADRWKLKPTSWDIHYAIIQGLLKPCVLVPQGQLQKAAIESGAPVPMVDENGPVTEFVGGWHFPVLDHQTGAYEAIYQGVADHPVLSDESTVYLLPQPLTLSYIMGHGVARMEQIEAVELDCDGRTADDLATKEKDSLLKMLSVILFDAYGLQNPYEKSPVPKEIAGISKKLGVKISDGTVLKYARMAYDECKPSMIDEGKLAA